MMKRKELSEDKRKRLLMSAQFMGTCIQLLNIEMQMDFVDTKLKDLSFNNHVRLIKQSLKAIEQHLGTIVRAKNKDELQYEFGVQMHRLVTHFCTYPSDKLDEFNDHIENIYGKTEAKDIQLEES